MITWDKTQYLFQTFSGDPSPANLTAFKLLSNLGYKDILHTFNGEETEDVRTWVPTASDIAAQVRGIKLAPNFIRIHSVTATTGTQVHPVVPEESQEKWNQRLFNNRSSSRPAVYFIRPRFGVGGSEILFDPTPSSTDLTVTINYAANARDLETDQYTTGTVTMTAESATVTGVGTTFTAAMVGRYFKVDDATGDGMWYRITGFNSPTSLTIENKYDGANTSGKSYIIAEAFWLPEDLQMGPLEYGMWYYYLGIRKDAKQALQWQNAYELRVKRAKDNYKKKNKSATINNHKPDSSIFPVATPNFWPDHVTG